MSIDVEYAIRKDIRNNPIVREVDPRQRHDFARNLGLAALIVAMLLFSALQHFQILRSGYEIQQLLADHVAAQALNRKLRLEVEALRAPQIIEARALGELHMQEPLAADTIVVERLAPQSPARAIVAHAR